MVLVQECTKYENPAKHTFKEDVSFEIMQHVFLVNFMNIDTFKHNIVHINHIDMDTTHNNTQRHLS